MILSTTALAVTVIACAFAYYFGTRACYWNDQATRYELKWLRMAVHAAKAEREVIQLRETIERGNDHAHTPTGMAKPHPLDGH